MIDDIVFVVLIVVAVSYPVVQTIKKIKNNRRGR